MRGRNALRPHRGRPRRGDDTAKRRLDRVCFCRMLMMLALAGLGLLVALGQVLGQIGDQRADGVENVRCCHNDIVWCQ